MKFTDNFKLPFVLGVISISCPFIVTALIVLIHLSYSDFWTEAFTAPEDDANRNAAAMMGAAEGIAGVLSSLVGCIAGLLLGTISFLLQERKAGVGLVGLLLNSFPFARFLLYPFASKL